MAYSAWSVVAGEQPTAAKWNILGTNDASFNDGTGIAAGAIGTSAIAADAVNGSKMIYGMIRQRQGGSAGDASWANPGTTNVDTSAKDAFWQVGIYTKASSSEESITFPVAFNQIPLGIVSEASANAANGFVRYKQGSTTTTVLGGIQCFNDVGTAITGESVAWLAIGQ